MLEKILLLISTAVYKTDALLYIQYAQFNCLKPNDPLVGRAVRYLNLPHVLTSPYGVANMYRIWKDFVHLCTSWTAKQLHVKVPWMSRLLCGVTVSSPPPRYPPETAYTYFSELWYVSAEL